METLNIMISDDMLNNKEDIVLKTKTNDIENFEDIYELKRDYYIYVLKSLERLSDTVNYIINDSNQFKIDTRK